MSDRPHPRHPRLILWLLAALAWAMAPVPPGQAAPMAEIAPPVAPKPLTTHHVFTHEIGDDATFEAYSREMGAERFTKFVIDVRSDTLWYFDVNVYPVHKDFVFAEVYREPITKPRLKAFQANYRAAKPEFILCYLVHHLAADVWTFSFWAGDRVTAPDVHRAWKRMKETFHRGEDVRFLPHNAAQEKMARGLPAEVPVITPDKLYKSSDYTAFNTGTAVGVLRIVPKGGRPESLTFSPDEIVILRTVLPDITPVAGILSETFSTPLAHVNLRARAWGIPNVGLKGAAKRYRALAGKTVRLEATSAGVDVRVASPDEIAAFEAAKTAARTVVIPPADLAVTELRPLERVRKTDASAFGAKTANLGEIASAGLSGFEVPAGFGVPIHYYDAHMKRSGLDAEVRRLLGDARFRKNAAFRKKALAALRKKIVATPLEPTLAAAVSRATAGLAAGSGVFVRSSTNAEDLAGFNGAGLYDTVPNVVGEAALHDAVRAVWASVWNLRAYEEREHFGIDHTRVYGGVLVQVGIDATAAGVLVTAHPANPSSLVVFTINAKSGLGLRVVEGKKVPEAVLYNIKNRGVTVLSRSDEKTMLVFDARGGVKEVPNPHKGKPILTNPRLRKLGDAGTALRGLFGDAPPLDIEWLFAGDTLYIVQARPLVTH